jgi:hypothetical protein
MAGGRCAGGKQRVAPVWSCGDFSFMSKPQAAAAHRLPDAVTDAAYWGARFPLSRGLATGQTCRAASRLVTRLTTEALIMGG